MRCTRLSSAAAAIQQAHFGQLLLLPQLCQHSVQQPLSAVFRSTSSWLGLPSWVVTPAVSSRSSVVAAAAPAQSKGKKAKLSKQHPSKQQLKQQKLKQKQMQQQQQQPGQQARYQPVQQQTAQQKQQPPQQKGQQGEAQEMQQPQQQQKQQQQRSTPEGQQQKGQKQHSGHKQNQQQHAKQQGQQRKGQKQRNGQKQKDQQQQQQQQPVLVTLEQPSHLQSNAQQKQRQDLQLIRPPQVPSAAATGAEAGGSSSSTATAAAAAAAAVNARQVLELIRPFLVTTAANEAASAAADASTAAAAAIKAAGLLPSAATALAAGPATGTQQQPSTPRGAHTSSSSSSSSDLTSPKQSPGKIGGVGYALSQKHVKEYRAAGVAVYDFVGADRQPQLLLVREKKGVWNLPAGKIDVPVDGMGHPKATASRELEEESHGLIPATESRAVLDSCPVFYCHAGKMVIYLMRYAGGQQLPQLLEQRLAAGLQHPRAEGVDKLGWFTPDQISSGVMLHKGRSMISTSSSSQDPAPTTEAAAAAAAAAAETEAVGAEDTAGLSAQLDSLQLQGVTAGVQQQQQLRQQEVEGPVGVRMPLFRNIRKIGNWLAALERGLAPAPGLEVVEQQQQQQQQLLAAPAVRQIQVPAKWVYVPGTSSQAAEAGDVSNVVSSSTVGGNGSSGGGQEFLLGGGSSVVVGQQQGGVVGTGSSSGQQPWAIAVWSGLYAKQQQQQQQQEEEEQQDSQ